MGARRAHRCRCRCGCGWRIFAPGGARGRGGCHASGHDGVWAWVRYRQIRRARRTHTDGRGVGVCMRIRVRMCFRTRMCKRVRVRGWPEGCVRTHFTFCDMSYTCALQYVDIDGLHAFFA